MFGAIMDAVMSIPQNMMMEEDRNQRQQDNWGHTFNEQTYNSAEAVKQRLWQEEMSNTQYQRAGEDLRRAGLNRILAVRQGGAGVPSGATASSGGSGGVGGSPGSIRPTFTQAEINSAQAKLMGEQTVAATQQGYNISADTEQKKQQTNLIMEQQKTQEQLTASARHNANILAEDEKGRKLEGQIDETRYGEVMRFINRAMKAVTGGASAYGNVRD